MKKFCMIAALATTVLGAASLAAEAGVAPSIGEAAKSVAQESKAGGVEQVHWRHRHHRRAYVYYAPRYYGYRSYRRW